MRVLISAATSFEIAPTLIWLESNFILNKEGVFENNDLTVCPLVTGVGTVATAFQLGHFFAKNRPDLAMNAGIAGAFSRAFHIGDVLNVVTERFGDLGVEEADGSFTDLFQLGLLEGNTPPFGNGLLRNPTAEQAAFLPQAHGLTVNRVHGAQASIEAIRAKYSDVEVESMEGAAFFYACLLAKISFLEIRSVSNYVEPRNREAWDIPLAINQLNEALIGVLETFIPH